MHVLPQLRELEHRFGDALLVIGVHAGKFPAERVTANIQQAVMRLGVDHPVVNDRQFRIWQAHAVRAWPTLVLIDPLGRQVGARPGEVSADFLAPILKNVLRRAEEAGPLTRRPLPLRPERAAEPERPLAFPAGVLTAEDGSLFIADTNHHRIIWAAAAGDSRRAEVLAIIGSGEAGLRDGDFLRAAFRRPHGLALAGDQLFVA
ncbi:MAG: alkyl hydroperoxide reductase, partial [Anaerolineae bacterium]